MTLRLLALAAVVLAMAVPAFAQAPSMDAADADDVPFPAMPPAPSGPPAGVRRITDVALSCEQIHAESRGLEDAIATQHAASEAAQREAEAAQQELMKGAAGGSAMPVASSLLGMLPGGGMISGMAAQAAMSARMSAMQDGTAKVTAAYQRVARAQEQLAYAQGRNDHLVDLFLKKNCKLPASGARP